MTLYLRFLFNLTIINPWETASHGKILHIITASMKMLQILNLVLENSPFPCTTAIFLNKISLEIKAFPDFFKSFHSSVKGSRAILLQTS